MPTTIQYPIMWVQPSTRTRITVWADYKRRTLYSHPSNTYPDVDEWPILYRRDVPNLTDDEWIAAPGTDWVREGADDHA